MIAIKATSINLSDEQKKLVNYNEGEGSLLVVAAAGSGKTRILTERVRYLLTEKIGKFSVLCLTFTKKAAEEMKERLSSVPDIARRAYIGTIHEFAFQMIADRREMLGFPDVPHIIDRDQDRKKILEQVFTENPLLSNSYKNENAKIQQAKLNETLNLISERKRSLDTVVDENEEQSFIYETYNQLLREQNMIDYDDILFFAYKLLTESQANARLYQRLYRYILIDEAQDLSFAQYHLIKAICGENHKNIFMVGDPKQAIHSYAGADTKFMLQDFIHDFNAKQDKITKNYRSSKKVIELANSIMQNGSNSEDAHYQGIAEVKSFKSEEDEALWIISQIKNFVLNKGTDKEIEGIISLDKIAILARNKFVFSAIDKLLSEDTFFKNKYFIKKATDGLDLETDFIKAFDLGTRILSNTANQLHFQEILKLLKINYSNGVVFQSSIEKLSAIINYVDKENTEQYYFTNILIEGWKALQLEKPMHKVLSDLSITRCSSFLKTEHF